MPPAYVRGKVHGVTVGRVRGRLVQMLEFLVVNKEDYESKHRRHDYPNRLAVAICSRLCNRNTY